MPCPYKALFEASQFDTVFFKFILYDMIMISLPVGFLFFVFFVFASIHFPPFYFQFQNSLFLGSSVCSIKSVLLCNLI